MLGRECVRSRNSLEVLALLPRYDAKAHGGDDVPEEEHTELRRLLTWRALFPVLAPLMPGSPSWTLDPRLTEEDEEDFEESKADPFAYVGQQVLFGKMRHVFMAPLLYLAGVCRQRAPPPSVRALLGVLGMCVRVCLCVCLPVLGVSAVS